ncbi:cytochrome c [Gluconacetobacter entanii]|uniref:c-type cytochrome n=1 Tax=Gluconacetobacter entanii TaxID=108528 RepID=UPI001C9367DB|nr:cytochrome c [Gluconacetobacter entanii]MBY4641358.1 cytochrome c [Gluconacetobacter entanii]MCW4581354.1 cytochrome c [Gluconacetobacter entanii]MCW4584806.1 cytochrome c [Gluconacetobacter entanii]MCW4588220.1 cytochrome c [Gluconacetobacter entanii]
MRPVWPLRILPGALLLLAAGCDDMSKQHKENPYASTRSAPADVAQGSVEYHDAPHPAPALTLALLQRGRSEYDAFCAPCHARTGQGDGMVVQRGFPAPLPLATAPTRSATPAQLYAIIMSGQGIMYGFAQRIMPDDRWAIVAYLYALRRSQYAMLAARPALPQAIRP